MSVYTSPCSCLLISDKILSRGTDIIVKVLIWYGLERRCKSCFIFISYTKDNLGKRNTRIHISSKATIIVIKRIYMLAVSRAKITCAKPACKTVYRTAISRPYINISRSIEDKSWSWSPKLISRSNNKGIYSTRKVNRSIYICSWTRGLKCCDSVHICRKNICTYIYHSQKEK